MRDEILAALLTASKDLSRDEPEVAKNIGLQLEHMGLSTWSISVRRRIRDAISRLEPKNVIQTGAGIGHLSAWLFDHFEQVEGIENFQMIEDGNRFAVILKRLSQRYSSVSSSIVVGSPALLCGELKAWNISKTGDSPILPNADAIIVDAPMTKLASDVKAMLPILNPNGVLFTVEPTPPVGDRTEDDPEVVGFNNWMDLIRSSNETHHLAFVPLFGGSIVAWIAKV
jgi:hypothetical protein|tara:strand:- start:107 stop:787 length:681 start_codon:yes stop_codon:yes gene_type:complete